MNQPNIGTYAAGTTLTVGSHQCRVVKYVTSGGYAQVYSAEMYPIDNLDSNIVCLKRVIVPDKPSLNTLRAEVDAMKLLKNQKHIVSYIDSHAAKSSLQDGSYEVFLLMEFCAGGGLIDFMNTRLQNRLQEYEILNIMGQVTQGIAAMHALLPPLIHRDIKIENVLISHKGEYKVCDFGSVCGVIRPPKNPQELSYVQHDVMKNTTAQYRSPEMIDLYRGYPIDEKSDIWALGVFLYKLCYYTTPFEKGGELAILHSRYSFPAQPVYSDRLKHLIQAMLMESPSQRPNICQVLEEVSRMQGIPSPIRNFYLLRAMEQSNVNANMQNYHLHNSKTQPILATQAIPIMDPRHVNGMNNIQQPTDNYQQAQHLNVSNTLPTFIPVLRAAKSPPIIQVNETKTAIQHVSPPNAEAHESNGLQKLKSAPSSVSIYSAQEKSGRGDINMIVDSNRTSFDAPVYVDSETQTFGSNSASDSYKRQQAKPPLSSIHSVSAKTSTITNKIPPDQTNLKFKSNPIHLTHDASSTTLDTWRKDSLRSNALNWSSSPVSSSIIKGKTAAEAPKKRDDGTPQIYRSSKQEIEKKVHELLNSSDEALENHETNKHNKESFDTKNEVITKDSSVRKQKSRPPPLPPKPAHLRPKKPAKPSFLSGVKLDKENSAVLDTKVEKLTKTAKEEMPGSL